MHYLCKNIINSAQKILRQDNYYYLKGDMKNTLFSGICSKSKKIENFVSNCIVDSIYTSCPWFLPNSPDIVQPIELKFLGKILLGPVMDPYLSCR